MIIKHLKLIQNTFTTDASTETNIIITPAQTNDNINNNNDNKNNNNNN